MSEKSKNSKSNCYCLHLVYRMYARSQVDIFLQAEKATFYKIYAIHI